jgi:alpha-tubulin suppressor-like RCC1 family protein
VSLSCSSASFRHDGAVLPHDGSITDGPAPGCVPACGKDEFCSLPGKKCVSAVKTVAAGTGHTCAVHANGRVSCWGAGAFIGPGLPTVTPPVAIDLPRAVSVAVGIQAACALLEGGTVSCWGDLGRGPEGPRAVMKEDGTALAGVSTLAGGSLAFCGLTPAGTHCWGDNSEGELARPVTMAFPARTAVLSHPGPRRLVAATVAILVHDGQSQLCGWGNNDSGIVPGPRAINAQPTCNDSVPGVLELSAGDGHACARRGGRTFSCWGSNSGGQLGVGDEAVAQAELPGRMETLPAGIAGIAAGAYHSCALLETGAVYCWGSNAQGECGVQSSSPHFAPTEVASLTAPLVAIGSGAGAQHTCGILADGSVQCWGSDIQGQLGAGATAEDPGRFSATPQQVRW